MSFKSMLNHSEEINQTFLSDKKVFQNFCNHRNDHVLSIFGDSKISNRPAMSCSALFLQEKDYQKLTEIALSLHKNVEKTANYLIENNNKRETLFERYKSYTPYLNKMLDTWQAYSRYDFVFDTNGNIKFLELNTSCPGGPVIVPKIHNFMKDFSEFSRFPYSFIEQKIDDTANFARELITMEREAGVSPKGIAILNDDFNMRFELGGLKAAFEQEGRYCVLAHLDQCRLNGQRLQYQNHDISLTYNKFRVAGDPGYCWPTNFQEKYSDYLQAMQQKVVLPVNNLMSIVYLSDKGLLSIMQDKEMIKNAMLDKAVLDYLPWSTNFLSEVVIYKDEEYEPIEFLIRQQQDMVLKHTGMSRGKNVFIGRDIARRDWGNMIQKLELRHYTAQEYVDMSRSTIVSCLSGNVEQAKMYQSGAIYIINSKPFGIMSRVSKERITNVGKSGCFQPVMVIKDSDT
jgi:hypothetical protein